MFIQVRLLNGFSKPLLYKVPASWHAHELHGTIIQVPVRNQIIPGVVIGQYESKPPYVSFSVREAHAIEPFPTDITYYDFITQLSHYYQVDEIHFIKRVRQFLQQKQIKHRKVTAEEKYTIKQKVTLTPEQKHICNFLQPHITHQNYMPTVLHGVTGSGKTESYKILIEQAIKENKTALLLLPEVTLAITFEQRLKYELGSDVAIFGFHSGKTAREKKLLWNALLASKPILIIGVHLPILLPIANLGLIIVDEEHEVGYQEKKHPKINSKEAALLRASIAKIPIVLGSATPSLQTLHNVKTKNWHFFQLKKRFSGAFPQIQTIFLLDKRERKNFWITQKLYNAIKSRLQKKQQTIIFLNRRGYSFFVQCKRCSFIFECKNCSVSLTLHEHATLTCHYCGLMKLLPSQCPSCAADQKQFLKKGIGTQQVVSILQTLFPRAHIARADLDTSAKKKNWQQTMQNMLNNTIDILVGTQTIAKGLHFPNVTLVGILWADLNLHFPMFNAAETTLQQLIQVAGRAGRNHHESTVIVQTMIDHPIFTYLNEIDYLKFFEKEMRARKELGYPPYKRLVEIELKHTDETIIERDAMDLMHKLCAVRTEKNFDVHILGPAKPPVSRVKRTYMRKIYLKGKNINEIIMIHQQVNQEKYKSSIFFTPNPVS